MSKFYKLVN
ncbi:TPA_asm: truncated E3 ubiquitin ligase p28-like protein [Vaccinia virus]|nr:TPA_asm: truncated E3 ubiquitin ligase p28-like protein [Vaccinia virus]